MASLLLNAVQELRDHKAETALVVGALSLLLLWWLAQTSYSKDGLKQLRYSALKLPLIGHAHLFLPASAFQRIQLASVQRGPLCKWSLFGLDIIGTTDADLVQELSERDDAFGKPKPVEKPMTLLRELAGDGLFTAGTEETAWRVAHRILTPVFALGALKEYVPLMDRTCTLLLRRMEEMCQREGSFDVPKLMTDMTFDTIGLCGMSTDLGSLQSDTPPAFIQAMNDLLDLTMQKTMGSELLFSLFNAQGQRRIKQALDYANSFVDAIVAQRRANKPPASPDTTPLSPSTQATDSPVSPLPRAVSDSPRRLRKDLLEAMLTETDGKNSLRLSDENIRCQLITFLVAGHETTSSLLSFALAMIAQHPEVERRLLAEIDGVFGPPSSRPAGEDEEVTFERIKGMPYALQVLKETLRLFPPAPAFQKVALQHTSLGGYRIKRSEVVLVMAFGLHRNPLYWEDPDRFDPNRFTPDKEAKRHPHAFKPWGDGVRACIGRQFALLEAKAVLAKLLSRYRVEMADPNSKVAIKEALTFKPDNLRMRLVPRQ